MICVLYGLSAILLITLPERQYISLYKSVLRTIGVSAVKLKRPLVKSRGRFGHNIIRSGTNCRSSRLICICTIRRRSGGIRSPNCIPCCRSSNRCRSRSRYCRESRSRSIPSRCCRTRSPSSRSYHSNPVLCIRSCSVRCIRSRCPSLNMNCRSRSRNF